MGDRVEFKLKNRSKDRTVGVVLAVDGINTLLRERVADRGPRDCLKWVLAPGDEYVIDSFWLDVEGKKRRRFNVLPDPESDRLVALDPDSRGLIAVYGFVSDLVKEPEANTPARPDAKVELKERSRSLSLRRGPGRTRGLIGEGSSGELHPMSLERVAFKYDPEPAVALFFRYYTRKAP
jgi:hypothetical protein